MQIRDERKLVTVEATHEELDTLNNIDFAVVTDTYHEFCDEH